MEVCVARVCRVWAILRSIILLTVAANNRLIGAAVAPRSHTAPHRSTRHLRDTALRLACLAILLLGALPLLPIQPVQAAVVTPFTVRKTLNDPGRIVQVGNTLLTCNTTVANCTNALNGTAPNLNNNDFVMQNVDVDADPTTVNSSRATLTAPAPGSTILFAYLYWGAYSTNAARNTVKFATPTSGGYQSLTGTILGSFPYINAQYNLNTEAYQGFMDVTALVQAGGFGTYTVANVQAQTGQNTYAGWALVTIVQVPNDPTRNLTVFDGFGSIESSATSPVDITVSGFAPPPAGPVHADVGVVAYEGDRGLDGDSMQFKTPTTSFTTLANSLNPANNFFNSTITDVQGRLTSKNPNFDNQLGFDIDTVSADNLIPNTATSATMRITTSGDTYYPGVITTAIDLFSPNLVITKSAVNLNGGTPGTVKPGDILEFTVTVQNTGLDFADNVTVSDVLALLNYIPGSLQIVSGPNAGPKTDAAGDDQAEFDPVMKRVTFRLGTGATATAGGSLAPTGLPGDTTTIRARAQIPATVYNGQQLSNSVPVTFTGRSSGDNFTVTSPPLTVTVATTADLAITKTHQGPIIPGQTVTYTITVTNNGPDYSDNDISGTDTLPNGLTFVSAAGNVAGSCAASGQVVTCNTATTEFEPLPPGGSFSFTITAMVAPGTPPNVTNTATVTSPAFDPDLSNNTATDPSTGVADLAVAKASSPNPYVPGQPLIYTVTVTNNGPNDVTNAAVSDPVPPQLAGSNFGWTCATSGGTNSCGATSGTGGITTTVSLAAGATATFTLSGTVPSGTTGELVNTATVTPPAGFTDPDPSNNTATDRNNEGALSDLSLLKSSSPNPYVPGAPLTYTIVATNGGPSDVTGAHVDDTLPAALAGAGFVWTCTTSGAGNACGAASGTGSIHTTVNLVSGGSATFTITGTVPSATVGQLANSATIIPPPGTTDPTPGNNTATDTNPTGAIADLSMTKTASVTTALPGQPLTWAVTVKNNGPSDVVGASVSDALPAEVSGAGFTWTCITGGAGNACGAASGSGNIATTVNLVSGGTAIFTITGTLPADATGTLVNTATVAPPAGISDPSPTNNTATVTTPVLAIEGPPGNGTAGHVHEPPGGTLQLTVTNGGQDVTASATCTASDPRIATVDASGKVFGITPGDITVTCVYQGTETTITVTIDVPGFTGIGANPVPQGRASGAAVGGTPPPVPAPNPRPGGASGQGGSAPASGNPTPQPLPPARR